MAMTGQFSQRADTVSNSGFLHEATSALPPGCAAWIHAFTGSPNSQDTRWGGQPYAAGAPVDQWTDRNTYYSVAALKPDEQGEIKRRKVNFARLLVLVADDVEVDSVPGPVSYVIATSPGKCQVGIFIDGADSDAADEGLVTRLVTNMASRGMMRADQAGNNVIRYVRLPVGQNHKPRAQGHFQHELRLWAPAIRLGLDDAAAALGIDLDALRAAPTAPPHGAHATGPQDERLRVLTANILAGEGLHDAINHMAASLVASGTAPGAVVNLLRGIMSASPVQRDERWLARYQDIPRAVSTAQEKYAQPARKPGGPDTAELDLLKNDKGVILACERNAYLLLEASEKFQGLHYDEFLSRMRLGERDWQDTDDLDAVQYLQATFRVAKFNALQTRNAARSVAQSRRLDSLRNFVDALPPWDGMERIAHAFTDAWGAPASDLMEAASGNFFIALIARALQPGAQVDTLWTFEGPQGGFKSKSLRVLGEHLQAEISAPIGSTDFQREMRGVWIAELSELDSIRGKESSTIKRLLSAPADRFVQKYENHAQSYPRRAVAVATTNEANYWQDSTGARRLVPITCGEIRIDLIRSQRLQWFAEAKAKYLAGKSWWEFPKSIADAQNDRQHVDMWEDMLRGYMEHGKGDGQFNKQWPTGQISTKTVASEWLDLLPSQQGAALSKRIGNVMRRLGYVPCRIAPGQQRGWERQKDEASNG